MNTSQPVRSLINERLKDYYGNITPLIVGEIYWMEPMNDGSWSYCGWLIRGYEVEPLSALEQLALATHK